ncbi:hypothetical protein [Reichenbachiella sp. MALMAid0571]|uniref:hypothetical protein n=1 Tax=Reichenbachiella sp. MALMAid0571 TaxID=3143939 RepID=UPI0032DFB420
MINLSIDAADMEGRFDPTVNEIESVFELVLEVVMDKGDILPEHDEPDPETETCFPGLYYIVPPNPFQLEASLQYCFHKATGFVLLSYTDPFLASKSPPPKSGTQTFLFT